MVIKRKTIRILKSAARKLSGSNKRKFMAETTLTLGKGAQRACESQLGWCRNTIRKGLHEINSGINCIDNFRGRGRKKEEDKNPKLISHIEAIVEGYVQADPSMDSERMYIKITAPAVLKQLTKQFNYELDALPSVASMTRILNRNGFQLKKVRKTIPIKKIPETDDIFDNLAEVNKKADESAEQLRISFDAKATVKMGNLSRGGKNRKETKADDHDFKVSGTITPVSIYLPKEKDLSIYMVTSKSTSDCYADILEDYWRLYSNNHDKIKQLIINLDNGPQQNSNTRQFMNRMQGFSDSAGIEIHLAYYPPYHSKYNPVERTLGGLERHWSGEILDSEEKVVGFAKTMQWAGKNPCVKVINKVYEKGVKVADKIMKKLNEGFTRKKGIEKWFVIIKPRLDFG